MKSILAKSSAFLCGGILLLASVAACSDDSSSKEGDESKTPAPAKVGDSSKDEGGNSKDATKPPAKPTGTVTPTAKPTGTVTPTATPTATPPGGGGGNNPPAPPAPVIPEKLSRGFEDNCTGCHGDDGEGNGNYAPALKGTTLTEEEFTSIVREGRTRTVNGRLRNMPAQDPEFYGDADLKADYLYLKNQR